MKVTLLTTKSCELCGLARAVLERLAAEYDLEITIIPLDTEAGQALGERGGILFPPGVFLDDEPFSYGRLSERKLRRELERRAHIKRA